MSLREAATRVVSTLSSDQRLVDAAEAVTGDSFAVNPDDFLSARVSGQSAATEITQQTAPLAEAGEIINRSELQPDESGRFTNVVTPVVIPSGGGFLALIPIVVLVIAGAVGSFFSMVFFGPAFWGLAFVVCVVQWLRRRVVMVPDGCQALIAKFGKVEEIVGPGRKVLFNPWKRVSYVVNTVREYPYNAPIREAPTEGGVKASVDLFLQFRIEDPAEFIFTLGATKGFSDKLHNAISEVTRALIYAQRAEDIYDLVGESTQPMIDSLNQQFLPAVRFTNANITHAEASSQDYRMDLAAPEMVRVAKEAYTFEYELSLRKEQNEGDLNKELASLQETLSAIRAEIAGYQAQMDTALERETNRAKAIAQQRYVEVESSANANASLLEAQALDIRAASAAAAPEILEYRFEQDTLDKLAAVASRMPQVVHVGDAGNGGIDFLAIARQLVGAEDSRLFTDSDLDTIRQRMEAIQARIRERETELDELLTAEAAPVPTPEAPAEEIPGEERVEEIRQSVAEPGVGAKLDDLAESPPRHAAAVPTAGSLAAESELPTEDTTIEYDGGEQ
jgi:regulator of protease activity HflC (stomatin/prohibitin superfamily)